MKTKSLCKRLVALAAAVCVAVCLALPVAAVEDTPQAVLDAKMGTVRVVSSTSNSAATGTGFAVGVEGKVYIVTNHHVVDGYTDFSIYYDSGKSVKATIYAQDVTRDLCILKPEGKIPKLKILQLETDPFESGIAVWALGFPAAADYFSQGEKQYATVQAYLADVIADKNSMSITSGIISAVHDSGVLIGDMTTEVKTIQTTTPISGGNSGGPLLNRAGRVVGINTISITLAEIMNGSVHVNELIEVLKEAHIKYEGTPDPEVSSVVSSEPEPEGAGAGLVVGLVLLGVVLAGGIVAALLVAKNRKKNPVKGGIALADYTKSYRKLDEYTTGEMAKQFITLLLPLTYYDINPLLTTDNVVIGEGEIALIETTSKKPADAKIEIYPGYSAPENYSDAAGQPAAVYFIGAMMYTMTTGAKPPEALGRKQENKPVFATPSTTLQGIINRAMEPYEQNRIADLYQLQDALMQGTQAMYNEVYGQQQQQGGYWQQ